MVTSCEHLCEISGKRELGATGMGATPRGGGEDRANQTGWLSSVVVPATTSQFLSAFPAPVERDPELHACGDGPLAAQLPDECVQSQGRMSLVFVKQLKPKGEKAQGTPPAGDQNPSTGSTDCET